LIDGAVVGELPWEGTLAPGRHVFSVRKGDVGSGPRVAIVVQGQTVLASTEAAALGAETRVVVEPASAELAIDGVTVGRGRWQGALPIGRHTFDANEEGYRPGRAIVDVGRAPIPDVIVRLDVDRSHPRWATRSGGFFVGGAAGVALAPGLGSDAESACGGGTCTAGSAALGVIVGAHVGYALPIGVWIDIGGGYLTVRRQSDRTLTGTFSTPAVAITYALNDEIRLSGPFVAGGFGYELGLSPRLSLAGGVDLGVVFVHATDAITGTATASGESAAVFPSPAAASAQTAAFAVLPRLDLRLRFGQLRVGAGLGAAVFPFAGPRYDVKELDIVGYANCPRKTNPASVLCAGGDAAIANERAYGTFALFVPGLDVLWRF
jgi:hypothetical protein